MPKRNLARWSSLKLAISLSKSRILPSLGRSKPANNPNKVVFPEPEAPVIATEALWGMAKVIFSSSVKRLPEGIETVFPSADVSITIVCSCIT